MSNARARRGRAFRRLVTDVTGNRPATEKEAFLTLKTVGVDTIEAVLLYHEVPGATIDSTMAAESDGAELTTAQGDTIEVDVTESGIVLIDQDADDVDPRLIMSKLDLNEGNAQIAHGISQVLGPIDL